MIKKTKLFFIFVGILCFGCEPDIIPPLQFDGEANMTIAQLKTLHELSITNPTTLIDTNAIITGLITSTDQYGSSHKEFFFQDETGGLSIRTSNNPYYTKYSVGQRIFVKAKDLYLGNYVSGSNYGYYQLCLYGGEGGTQYLSLKMENQHVFRSGMPEPCPNPKIITKTSDIDTEKDYHTLVKLVNCYFTEANGTTNYFETTGTLTTISRYIRFNLGSGEVQARISAFCTFANNTLPEGALNITGILTKFGSSHQLIICSMNDVQITPKEKILKAYDMSVDPFTLGWINKQITGATQWTYHSSLKNMSIQAPAGEETECWFVSPKLNFSGEKDIALAFNYRIPNGTKENIEVKYSVNGSTWTSLEFVPDIGPNSNAVFKLPDTIATNPNLQIAFQYKTTDIYPMWAISKIEFKANVSLK
jgi:hypothetical protein